MKNEEDGITRNTKEELSNAITVLAQLAEFRSSKRLMDQARSLEQKLSDFIFNLVVIGEFKRGKSTLINALLGASVLPVAAIPLTSVATIVRYGDESKIRIGMVGGEVIESDIKALPEYITERGNPTNKRGVSFAEVEWCAQILKQGVRIVDTPGTGSVYQHNTQTTYDFLPEADAIVFVFVADQPATQSELELLRAASKLSAFQIFVLNKADHLDEQGKAESEAFIKDVLAGEFKRDCFVFTISAKQALEAKLSDPQKLDPDFVEFEKSLSEFAIDKKKNILLQSIKAKIENAAAEIEQLIQLERAAMDMPASKLETSLKAFCQAQAQISQDSKDAEFIVKGEVQKLANLVAEDLRPVVEKHCAALRSEVEQEYERNRTLDNDALVVHLRNYLQLRIASIFDAWKFSENKKIEEYFERLNGRFVEKANGVVADIKRLTEDLFQVEVVTSFEVAHLENKDKHRYAVDNPFTLSLEILPLLLPSALSKPIIRARFIEAAEHELTRNSGRLRADYQERLETSARTFLTQFNSRISAALGEIEAIIIKGLEKQSATASVQTAVEGKLSAQTKLLQSLRQVLDTH